MHEAGLLQLRCKVERSNGRTVERSNRLSVALVRVFGLTLGLAATLKLLHFSATALYVANSLQVLASIAPWLTGLVILGELILCVWTVARPTSFAAVRCAGWTSISFAGWHAAGLLIGAKACPCFGPVTELMNPTVNQLGFGAVCAIIGILLLFHSVSLTRRFL